MAEINETESKYIYIHKEATKQKAGVLKKIRVTSPWQF
jgi:hypothetical protein